MGLLCNDNGTESNHTACYADLLLSIFAKNPDPTAPHSRGFTQQHKQKAFLFGDKVDQNLQKM